MNAQRAYLGRHWLDRFGEYCYRASIPRVIQYLRNEATLQYEGMINDLDTPMDREFEETIAAQLPVDQGYLLKTDKVLLPAMSQRLGANLSAASGDEMKRMSKQCQRCNQVRQCWLAMRRGTEASECARFCRNADNLISLRVDESTASELVN